MDCYYIALTINRTRVIVPAKIATPVSTGFTKNTDPTELFTVFQEKAVQTMQSTLLSLVSNCSQIPDLQTFETASSLVYFHTAKTTHIHSIQHIFLRLHAPFCRNIPIYIFGSSHNFFETLYSPAHFSSCLFKSLSLQICPCNVCPSSLPPTRNRPYPKTIDSTTILPTDALTAPTQTTSEVQRLAQPDIMPPKASRNLHKNPRRFKTHLDENFGRSQNSQLNNWYR